tara:strand:+ start:19640 stop:20275 length:636 start_codon:yes stop_codon:yes gene_type:complete
MASKNTYYVGSGGFSNYAQLTDIPSDILAAGDTTIIVGPGTYTPLTDAVLNDISFVGQGNRDEIVVSGNMTIANTSTGVTRFENLTLTGTGTASAVTGAVTKLGLASAPLHFRRCTINSTALGVVHHATSAFATTTKQVVMDHCDATGTNRAIYSNANVAVNFSALNTVANAYHTYGAGGVAIVGGPTVRASTGGAANVGNSTETIIALLS